MQNDFNDLDFHIDKANIKLMSIDGIEFENEFHSIMKCIHGTDFIATIPMGSRGDLKCDGFSIRTGTVYQCYSPRYGKIDVNYAIKKIEQDFIGAHESWKDKLKKWAFVVNVYKDKVSPELIEKITQVSQQIGVEFILISRSDILDLVRNLPHTERVKLYGAPRQSSENQKLDHDVKLYNDLKCLLGDSGVIKFLDEQDVGYGYEIRRIKGLWHFASEWKKPELKFRDEKINEILLAMLNKAEDYENYHSEHMIEHGNRYNFPYNDSAIFDDKKYVEIQKIKRNMHKMSSEFVDLYNKLIKMCIEIFPEI